MVLDSFGTPGNVDDLKSPGRQAWSNEVRRLMDRQVADTGGPTSQFFDAVGAEIAKDAATRELRWGAFPRKLARLPAPERWTLGEVRDRQEEYCEWAGVRDSKGRLVRAMFTTEVPSYFHLLAATDQDRLVDVYREEVSPHAALRDLVSSSGAYRERNPWNLTGAMHLIQPNNTLAAAIVLVAQSTVVRSRAGNLVTNANDLIRCGVAADADRNSDPLIVGEVNALARRGADITLADPVGLYIDNLRTDGWVAPKGADPRSFWRTTRGDEGTAVRAVYEVPSKLGFAISDIRIDGIPITSPSQIAEAMEIKVVGLAHRFDRVPTAQPCAGALHLGGAADGPALAAPTVPSVEDLLALARDTR